MLLPHAAQNLRTNSIGFSIWLLQWSIVVALGRAPISGRPSDDTIPALPVAAAASMNLRRETLAAGTPAPFSKSFFMSFAPPRFRFGARRSARYLASP